MKQSCVLDPSILIQAYIADTDSARVQTLLAGLENDPPDEFYIPDFCLLECTNILWKRVRFNGMPVAQAKQAVDDLRALSLLIVLQPTFCRVPSKSALYSRLQSTIPSTLLWPNGCKFR